MYLRGTHVISKPKKKDENVVRLITWLFLYMWSITEVWLINLRYRQLVLKQVPAVLIILPTPTQWNYFTKQFILQPAVNSVAFVTVDFQQDSVQRHWKKIQI